MSPAPPDLRNPVFVVGSVRGGTTLLAACLDAHPAITYVPYELAREWCAFAGPCVAAAGLPVAHCPPRTAADATPEIRERVRRGFARIFTEAGGNGSTRFLNKNPHLCNKLPFLQAIFPDARIIITSRDLRSTVLSTQVLWMKVQRHYGVRHILPPDPDACWSLAPPAEIQDLERTFPGGAVHVLAEYWLNTYEQVARAIPSLHAPLFIRHRDLVAAPERTLNHLLEGLGLPPIDPARLPLIDPHRNQRWDKLLARAEREQLDRFIEEHRPRIEALPHVDTTL